MEVGFAAAAAAAVESGASPLPVQVWLEQSLISNIMKKIENTAAILSSFYLYQRLAIFKYAICTAAS